MEQLPSDIDTLIEELDKIFPLLPPDLNDSEREIWFKAGQRDVAKKLRADLDKLKDIYFNKKTLKGQR